MRRIIISLILFFLMLPTASQARDKQRIKLWNKTRITTHLDNANKWLFQFETNLRFFNPTNFLDQNVNRTVFGYQMTDKVSVWLGYVFAITRRVVLNDFAYEHRPYYQLVWKMVKAENYTITYRTRLETREQVNTPRWAWRLRQYIVVVFPRLICGQYAFIISNEVFFNLNHPVWVSASAISENRVFIGVGIPVLKNSLFEIGYMNQVKFQTPNVINHILYTVFKVKI